MSSASTEDRGRSGICHSGQIWGVLRAVAGLGLRANFGIYNPPRGTVRDTALIRKMAENALALAVDAYDQDGLLIWQGPQLPQRDQFASLPTS
jgi:hypothetical protein